MAEEKATAQEALAGSVAELRSDAERLSLEKVEAERVTAEELSALRDSIRLLEGELSEAASLSAKQLTELREEAERLAAEKSSQEEVSAAALSALRNEVFGLKNEIQSAREAAAREISDLKSEAERLVAERTADEVRFAEELARLREESERLLNGKDDAEGAAASELEVARSTIARLSAEIREIETAKAGEITAINAEIERLTLEKEAVDRDTAAELRAARVKAVQLAADLLETEISIVEKTAAARSAARMLMTAIAGEEATQQADVEDSDLSERMAGLLIEADRLAAEKVQAEDSTLAELAELKANVARLASENTAARQAAAAEAETLKAEAQRLIAERREAEQLEAERLAHLAAEIERLAKESAAAREAVSVKMARLKVESDMMNTAKEALENAALAIPDARVTVQECRPDKKQPIPSLSVEEVPRTVEPVRTGSMTPGAEVEPAGAATAASFETVHTAEPDDETDPFAFMRTGDVVLGTMRASTGEASGPPVRFTIDRAIQGINFSSPEDVLEVHQSLNRTRVAMEDSTTETCDSYLCVVEKNGKPHVYIALYLVDGKKALVYIPEKQPDTPAEFDKVMRDGMDFIEIVGFMMDVVDLGRDKQGRSKVLNRIPVLIQAAG